MRSSSTQALPGIKVLNLCRVVSGPFATMATGHHDDGHLQVANTIRAAHDIGAHPVHDLPRDHYGAAEPDEDLKQAERDSINLEKSSRDQSNFLLRHRVQGSVPGPQARDSGYLNSPDGLSPPNRDRAGGVVKSCQTRCAAAIR